MSSFAEYADTVQKLIRFAEVRECFKGHIGRWRRKKSLIQANKAKAEEALERWLQRKKKKSKTPPDWPVRRVRAGANSRLVQVPPELARKVEKREALEGNLLSRLAQTPFKEFTRSEQFAILAQIHDSQYQKRPIGRTDLFECRPDESYYPANVAILGSKLTKGREPKQIEASRLHDALAFVLARIEAKFDPELKDEKGDLLIDVIARLRQKWELHSSRTLVVQSQIVSARDSRTKSQQPTAEAAGDDKSANFANPQPCELKAYYAAKYAEIKKTQREAVRE